MNFKFQKETDPNLVSSFLNEYGTLQGFYHAILTKAWDLFNKVAIKDTQCPKIRRVVKTSVKDQTASSFMLYSVMNHYKEKNLKSIDRFWRKLGF